MLCFIFINTYLCNPLSVIAKQVSKKPTKIDSIQVDLGVTPKRYYHPNTIEYHPQIVFNQNVYFLLYL